MRITHISVGSLPQVFSAYGGAIQRRVAELAQEQSRRGHQVTVFSPGETSHVFTRDGIRVRYVRTRLASPWSHLEYQMRVVSALLADREKPEVLHFHSEPEGAILSAPLRTVKVLSYDNFFFRGGKASRMHPAYRRALDRFDLLLPCSRYCAAESIKYWSLPSQKVRVLYNGVNTDQFHPDATSGACERERIGATGRVLLYVGRVCRQKGSDVLLTAYEEVQRSLPDAQLVVAGPIGGFDGNGGDEGTDWWKERLRDARATYLGRVPDDRLSGVFNMADVLVMPTIELEMFGMAAIEAEACGTPVVATDHGGLRETVPTGCGLRVPPGDSAALADAIASLLDNEGTRHEYALRAREHASTFAWDRIAAQLDELYDEAPRKASGLKRHLAVGR